MLLLETRRRFVAFFESGSVIVFRISDLLGIDFDPRREPIWIRHDVRKKVLRSKASRQ